MTTRTSCLPILGLGAMLAGCEAQQDFARPGTWQATGANEANLRAMLVEPDHARRGVGAVSSRARPATLAIRRLERDRRRPLPESRASAFGGTAGASPASAPEPAHAP